MGVFQYKLNDGSYSGKLGAYNEDAFFYIESTRKLAIEGQYGVSGDSIYGTYKNYIVADVSTGGSSRNGLVFLLKLEEGEFKLLDVIGEAFISKLQLIPMLYFEDYKNNPYNPKYPAASEIKDFDGDGYPDIKTVIFSGPPLNAEFFVYFSIKNDRLTVNFNPSLYFKNFSAALDKNSLSHKLFADYICQSISTNSSNDAASCKHKEINYTIVRITNNLDEWNSFFHMVGGDNFIVN